MTLTPHEVAVSQLGTGHGIPLERITSLRFIKNNIIGNKTKKNLYIKLGILSRYYTNAHADSRQRYQGSVCCGLQRKALGSRCGCRTFRHRSTLSAHRQETSVGLTGLSLFAFRIVDLPWKRQHWHGIDECIHSNHLVWCVCWLMLGYGSCLRGSPFFRPCLPALLPPCALQKSGTIHSNGISQHGLPK